MKTKDLTLLLIGMILIPITACTEQDVFEEKINTNHIFVGSSEHFVTPDAASNNALNFVSQFQSTRRYSKASDPVAVSVDTVSPYPSVFNTCGKLPQKTLILTPCFIL